MSGMKSFDSSESSLEDNESYDLHPQIMNKIKVDKGSMEAFVKMDDIDRMFQDNDKYCDNYILSKIDKTGLVGKLARADIRSKQVIKERYFFF